MKQDIKIDTREEFPVFLNECGLTGKGAKIGVQHGDFSEHILKNWIGDTLFSIDA